MKDQIELMNKWVLRLTNMKCISFQNNYVKVWKLQLSLSGRNFVIKMSCLIYVFVSDYSFIQYV